MYKLKLSQGGRLVIPAEYRKAIGLNIGDDIMLRVEDGEIRLTALQQSIQQAQAAIRRHVDKDRSLVDELIAERKEQSRSE